MSDSGSVSAAESAAPAQGAAAPAPRASRGRIVIAAVVAAVVIGIAAFSAGWLAAPRIVTPSDTSVEAGFARDMQQHHDQAVQMAMIIRQQSDDPEVSSLAYDIATSQAQQSGQMYGWLNLWQLPQASSQPTMTWMLQPTLDGSDEHAHGGSTTGSSAAPSTDPATGTATDAPGSSAPDGATSSAPDAAATAEMVPGGPMPGMAGADDIARLSTLTGVEAEKLFLQLMIAHHKGGVEMADAVIARTTNPVVLALAKAIVFAQNGEIQYMQELLAARE